MSKKKMFQCKSDCKAECCGITPIPRKIYIKNRKKIKREFVKDFYLKGNKVCITRDGKCIFLDNNNKCNIYDDRPYVCKNYGIMAELPCPYIDADGNYRSSDNIEIIKEKIKKMDKDRLNLLVLYGKHKDY